MLYFALYTALQSCCRKTFFKPTINNGNVRRLGHQQETSPTSQSVAHALRTDTSTHTVYTHTHTLSTHTYSPHSQQLLDKVARLHEAWPIVSATLVACQRVLSFSLSVSFSVSVFHSLSLSQCAFGSFSMWHRRQQECSRSKVPPRKSLDTGLIRFESIDLRLTTYCSGREVNALFKVKLKVN